MTAQIRPNRMQVNDRFPMLGFAVRTAQPQVQAEVVLASAIDLFRPENRARRTAANFYTSREHGLLSVPRGEGVFVVPPEVLARFIGQEKLFFALATGRADQGGLQVDAVPREGSPYVSLSGFTGRTLRRSFAPARAGASPLLEWTGDAAQPGTEPARVAQPVPASANPPGQAQPAAPVHYNDGFGDLPELPAREAAFRGRAMTAEPANARAVMPDLPGNARQRANRIGGGFGQRIGEALDLGLSEASVTPLLDTLDRPQQPIPLYNQGATPMSRAQSVTRSVHWPDIELVNQPTDNGCWATTIAMLMGWHDQTCIDPRTIAQQAGCSIEQGLQWSQHRATALQLGLNPIPPQCYTAEGLYDLIEREGPLYVSKMATASTLSGHAVLVCGMYEDGGQFYVRIADPWDRSVGTPGNPGSYQSTHSAGSRYIMRFEDFENEYELQAVVDLQNRPQGEAYVQMFSIGVPAGRQPDRSGNPPAGFAMTLGSAALDAGTTRSIQWDDVRLIAQPTPLSCWAASAAMVLEWHNFEPYAAETVAAMTGRDLRYVLPWAEHDDLGRQLGWRIHQPMCYTPEGFWRLIEENGPVWVGKSMGSADGNTHIVVVVGMLEHDGGYHVRVLDPANGGTRYVREFNTFSNEYELGMRTGGGEIYTQILTAGIPAGRTINRSTSAPASFAMGAGDNWSINWDGVDLVNQPTDNGCWATTLAMMIGWRDGQCIAPESIAQQCGKDIAAGLPWAERQAAASTLGLTAHPPQCYLPEGFRSLIENNGPLYVGKMASSTNLSGHAVLVVGMYADNGNYYVRVTDPWDRPTGTPGSPGNYAPTHNTGSRYIMRYDDFQLEYEMAAAGTPAYVQILSGGVPLGRTPNRNTAPTGYAMAIGSGRTLPPPPRPARRSQAMDAAAILAGTAIQVISANSGDITTNLSNWAGVKHPNDRAPSSSAAFQDGTVTLRDWPVVGGTFGLDDIYCWLQIRWQYNGTSLGRIYVEDIGHDDAAGWGLTVNATIEDDSRLYARSSQARAAGPAQVPALHINIQYVFDEVIADDQIANTVVTLYADGTYDVTSRWVQHSRPGGGNPTNVVRPFEYA
jgi:hypothetical protein